MPVVSIYTDGQPLFPYYYLSALGDFWVERGLTVRIGADPAADTDVAVLHVNRTRIDPALLRPVAHGVPVVNGTVLDISKRLFSTLEVRPGDDWAGPVIVKTNLNHFGIPEEDITRPDRAAANRKRMAQISWRSARRLPERTYPVLPDQMAVPRWVWQDDSYIVEKFLPERDGDLYALRGWAFFGDREYGWRILAHDPMVKVGSRVCVEYLTDVPPEIKDWRQRSGFDFGKFDYVLHGDKALLFDMNKTPTFVGDRRSPRLDDLARGIEAFLP